MEKLKFLETVSNITVDKIKSYQIITPEIFEEVYNSVFNELNTLNLDRKITTQIYMELEDNLISNTALLSNNLDRASIAINNNDNDVIKELKNELEILKHELEKSQKAIYTDHLTSVYNRRWLTDKLTTDNIFTTNGILAFIDLNDFKKINDTLGHNIGDKVLQLVSQAFLKIENTDVIRYAGDEFILFSNTLRLPQLESQLDNILKYFAVRKLTIKNKEVADDDLRIKFSFGLIKITHGDDVKEKIKIADEKMYEDKIRRKSANL